MAASDGDTAPGPSKSDAATQPLTKAERAKAVMNDPKVVHSSYVPAQLHRHLEFLKFNRDGHMILGCSDLTGRNWSGSLWYYRNPEEPPSVEKALTGIDLDQSVIDGKFVANNRMLVGLDNGALEQVTLAFCDEADIKGDSFFFLERQYCVQEHDDLISGLDLTSDPLEGGDAAAASHLVTVSYDRSIVVMDVATLRLETRITEAHDNVISDVSANKTVKAVIATAAQDGAVQLWDIRTRGKLSRIYHQSSDWPTTLEWVPGSEHNLMVGSQTGKVSLMDTRNSSQPLSVVKGSGIQAHKIEFNGPGQFALCCDSTQAQVFRIEGSSSMVQQYIDSRHTDYVRGLAWRSDKLYTCGWDHQVFCHDIPAANI